jgi:hypothetical protein
MTLRSTVSMFSMALAFTFAAPATTGAYPAPAKVAVPDSRKPDLRKAPMVRRFDAELGRTGHVAVPDLRGEMTGIVAGSIEDRPEVKVPAIPSVPSPKPLTRISLRDDPTLRVQYGKALGESVEECRFDVARRFGITPVEVAADVLVLRWTIEPSGRVRDVSAVASFPSDEAVKACAKGVVSTWPLLSQLQKPVALEWSYTFRQIPATSDESRAKEDLPSKK